MKFGVWKVKLLLDVLEETRTIEVAMETERNGMHNRKNTCTPNTIIMSICAAYFTLWRFCWFLNVCSPLIALCRLQLYTGNFLTLGQLTHAARVNSEESSIQQDLSPNEENQKLFMVCSWEAFLKDMYTFANLLYCFSTSKIKLKHPSSYPAVMCYSTPSSS